MTYNVLHPWSKQKIIWVPNLLIAMCIVSIVIGMKYIMDYKIGFDEFNKHTCNITNITYPIEPYSSNYKINWKRCKCDYNGNNINGVMPCIKLYDNNIGDKMIINYFNGIGSRNYGDADIHSNKECTWTVTDLCSCDKTLESIETYLKNMYNYTIGTNFDCYYKNENNTQIYFNIGDYDYSNLALIIIMGIIPISLTIVYMNYASVFKLHNYIEPFTVEYYFMEHNKNERNFYFVDFYMWFLLILKGLIIIGTPIIQCCCELYNYCLIIDTNIHNAVVSCLKIKSGNKKNIDPINVTNGDIEYCHSYGTIDSSNRLDKPIDV